MKKYKLQENNILPVPGSEDTISIQQLTSIDDNSIDYINCLNILEITDDPLKILSIIESKLRLSGKCYIIGININNLCEYYLDNIINIELFNQTIKHTQRLFDIVSIKELVENKFTIETIKTHGIYYHIMIKRRGVYGEK